MDRYIIGSLWDRVNRNGANKNFEYLFEGRRKIDELNYRANSILNEAQSVNDKNVETNKRLDNIIADSGTSSTEVVDARGRHTVLSKRLKENEEEINHQKSIVNREVIAKRNRKPMISIIDDDGRIEFLQKWVPILQEKTFKISTAVITSYPDNFSNFMTWDQLHNLVDNYNVDVVNHTHTHPQLGTLSEEEVINEHENSVKILKEHGFSHDVMVYPGGSHNATSRSVTRNYCRVGIGISGGINVPPMKSFLLNRQSLMNSSGEMGTVESYTQYIDEAITNNGWIIFMTHSQYSSFDSDKIKSIIDYANSKEIEWVSASEGLDNIGNIIDYGDYIASVQGAEYTILDADGAMHSKTNSKDFWHKSYLDTPEANSILTDYENNTTTKEVVLFNNTIGFPRPGGVLETTRIDSDALSHQLFYTYNENTIYKRRWLTGNQNWTEWEKISITPTELKEEIVYVRKPINHMSESDPLSQYESERITVFAVNGINTFNGKSGIVTTWNIQGNGWSRQELRVHNSNQIFSRYATSSGWSEWEKISAV